MQQMTYLDTATLRAEINLSFPFVEMPPTGELLVPEYAASQYLAEELEQYRPRQVDGGAIRLVHQELPHLSAKAWRWILPHYLRFCLTPEAEYNRMETEFLIYNLGPSLRFQSDTNQRLSLLTTSQVLCLIDFLFWCENQEYWKQYCPSDISRAIGFLKTVLLTREHDHTGK